MIFFSCTVIQVKTEINNKPCAPNDPEHRRKLMLPVDEASIEVAARIFRAMGDPPRLRTLAMLSQGEACVSEIAAATNEELSTISQRLRVLRSENLLVRRRQGKHILYSLADQHVSGLIFNALAHSTEHPVGKVTKGRTTK